MRRWYIVYTRTQAEWKAYEHLGRQGFDAYLPCYRKLRRHARRRDVVRAPLFPRYLFVAVDLVARGWRAINGTRGVCHLVGDGARPTPVPDDIVNDLRAREDERGVLPLASLLVLERGARVRIVDGAMADQTGIYERMTDDERIVILLNLFGRAVRVELPMDAIDAA